MRKKLEIAALAALMLALAAPGARAQEAEEGAEEAEVTGFLVEEAYNQEAGELQQILSWTRLRGGAWSLDYSQEWPLWSVRHQLEVGIPLQRVGARGAGFQTGIGDMEVGYRYQLLGGEDARLTLSPGLELTLPTGSESRGLGEGSTEVEVALPATLRFGPRLFTHTSVGVSRTTGSGAGLGAQDAAPTSTATIAIARIVFIAAALRGLVAAPQA